MIHLLSDDEQMAIAIAESLKDTEYPPLSSPARAGNSESPYVVRSPELLCKTTAHPVNSVVKGIAGKLLYKSYLFH
jgi:hypothetical protein